MMRLTTADRLQEAVAAFEAGKTTLAALETVIGEMLRTGGVSADVVAHAVQSAVTSGKFPSDSVRRLGLVDGSAPGAPTGSAVGNRSPPSSLPKSDAAETTLRPVHASAPVRTPAPQDRTSTGSSWEDPGLHAATSEVSVGTLLGGRYRLERVIGEGGMGVVFLASDQEVKGENFAIKVLKPAIREYPEALDLLREEVRRTRALGHPNIVGVYSLNSERSNVYMIMEYLEGKTLGSLIDEDFGRGVPFMRAWPLIEDMCAGLAFAHDQSVVHSDIKTSNVFITMGGKAKLLDFGIARAARGRTKRFDPGGLGALTPTYASCEMLDGRNPDARDDIYSLACVIYEMLSGKHPFNEGTAVEARDQKLVPSPISSLSPSQNAALVRALAFDRDTRTASVELLREGLAPSAKGGFHTAAGGQVSFARRSPTVLYAGGAVLLAAVLIALFIWLRHSTVSAGERTAAVKAQTTLSQLMLRIEASQRKSDDRLRDARSLVDRLTDRANLARTDAERDSLNKQLAEAQAAADADQAVNTVAEGAVFSVEKLAALREKQRSGEVALQAGRNDEAAKALSEARHSAEDILAAADALPLAVADQRELAALLLRARDAIASSHGDADAALAKARLMADQAAQQLAGGDPVGARQHFSAVMGEVNKDMQAFFDRVIAELAAIAKKKMDDNDLDVAQAAISQAETLQKEKASFQ